MAIKGKVIKIGRAEDNHIVCAHQTVNKYHAELFVDADGDVFLTDLSSTNGSFVNGKRVYEPALLKEGDILKIAENILIDWQRVMPKKSPVTPITPTSSETFPLNDQNKSNKPSFEPEKPSTSGGNKNSSSLGSYVKRYWDVFAIYIAIVLMVLAIRFYIG
jgi:pSer/pThr/pTyr-binding forkhead associated (FHA) protein